LIALRASTCRHIRKCKCHLKTLTLTYSVPLTDDVLKEEIGISKIGHRLRLLSQLRQDALTYFYDECVANFSLDINMLMKA
jgi:hypothetical protein